MRKWLRARARGILVGLIASAVGLAVVCQVSAYTGQPKVKTQSIKGLVCDTHSRPSVGATVYFIDTSLIDTTSPLTYGAVLDGSAEAYDEPLEDIINNADKVKTLPKAVTDAKGQFKAKLNAAAKFFAFVVPNTKDIDHLPGGDASRVAFSPKGLGKTGLKIQVSWKTPADATYIGTTACYVCHGPGSVADVSSCKKHAHALMFRKMGQDTANQNGAAHAGSNWDDWASKFTLATDYNKPVAPATSVKTLYFMDYDVNLPTNPVAAPSTSKSLVCYEDAPGTRVDPATGKVYAEWVRVYLWKDAAGNYKATLENKQSTEPVLTLDVVGTMGGYIRQRLVVRAPGLKGVYQFIGYQALPGSASQGNDKCYDRTRRKFNTGSPGGGGLTTFYNLTTKKLITAPAGGTGAGCAGCHVGGGPMHQQTTAEADPATGERLSSSTPDINGALDFDGDGTPDDVGITCEVCHGPGSRHRAEAMLATPTTTTTSSRKTPVDDHRGKFIVNPDLLGADRASLVCGRCHIGGGVKDVNNFAPPGISRAEYLANYVSSKGPGASSFSSDGQNMNGGHEGIAFDNWMESKHSRNKTRMVACHDCHDAMGDSPYRYSLKGDPDSSTDGLCNQCHTSVNVNEHVTEKTGAPMTGTGMLCRNCHMPRVGKGGAGRPGLILGTPTGLSSDANIMYWENDQSSHLFEPPNKFNAGVAGKKPGYAMPVPYTNSCGTCHDASKLQYQSPN
jgi:hypothetical protein